MNNQEVDKKIMSIVAEDGSIEEVEVILAFEFKDTNKEYVIYTKNEKDENDNITVYVSNVDRSSGEPKLLGVDDEEFKDVEGDADSLAGLVLELKGDFPSIHEKFDYKNYTFEIMGMEGRRISRIKVIVHEAS